MPQITKQKQNKLLGLIYGMYIGDALGAQNEFKAVKTPVKANAAYKAFIQTSPKNTPLKMLGHSRLSFMLSPGQWTDDSSMGTALLDVLSAEKAQGVDIANHFPHEKVIFAYLQWLVEAKYSSGNNAVGLGDNISKGMKAVVSALGCAPAHDHFSHWQSVKSLVDKGEAHFLQQLKHKNINVVETVEKSLAYEKSKDGNGSIMRNIVSVMADNVQDALKLAFQQSKTTTSGQQSAQCAMLQAYISFRASNEEISKADLLSEFSMNDFITMAEKVLGEPLHPTVKALCKSSPQTSIENPFMQNADGSLQNYQSNHLNWRTDFDSYQLNPVTKNVNCGSAKGGYYGAYVIDGMALALHVYSNSQSYEEAVTRMTLYNGDSDTTSAIVGIMAGAFYGKSAIPQVWQDTVGQHPINKPATKHNINGLENQNYQHIADRAVSTVSTQAPNHCLITIIDELADNIKYAKNNRKTTRNSQAKVTELLKIKNQLIETLEINQHSLRIEETQTFIDKIEMTCAKRRNFFHFWAEPASLVEFKAALSKFDDINTRLSNR